MTKDVYYEGRTAKQCDAGFKFNLFIQKLIKRNKEKEAAKKKAEEAKAQTIQRNLRGKSSNKDSEMKDEKRGRPRSRANDEYMDIDEGVPFDDSPTNIDQILEYVRSSPLSAIDIADRLSISLHLVRLIKY